MYHDGGSPFVIDTLNAYRAPLASVFSSSSSAGGYNATLEREDLSPGLEGQTTALWNHYGVLALHDEAVALSVGDDQDGTVLWKILRPFEKVDPRL
jgi:hypothetical protein